MTGLQTSSPNSPTNSTVAGRWELLNGYRSAFLQRCRECAKLTVPSLLPDDNVDSSNDALPIPYQSLGAKAVNNLAAKLLLTLFPPNTSFFRLDPDPISVEELKDELGDQGFKQQIEKQLRVFERMSTQDFEAKAMRAKMFKVLRHLVTIGNVLLELEDDGKLKVYRLDKYVTIRKPNGELKEAIIQEMITYDDIPEGIETNPIAKMPKDPNTEIVPLYTHILLQGNTWHVDQECCGVMVPDSEATYPKDKLPFLALTWQLNDGENYGRGHVEENLGDLVAYDSLRQSILEGASAAAFFLIFVKPNGTTKMEDIQGASNGAVKQGNADDVSVLHADKAHDFKIAFDQAAELRENIGQAFLLTDSIQRNAERVTAEEIRLMAQELESTLGGIYSVLGVELQKPFCRLLMANQAKRGKLPGIPDGVETTITTGFDALGRGHDLQRLREFRDEVVNLAQATGSPQEASMLINTNNFVSRVATAMGLDTDGLVPSQEEIEQRRAAMNQQAQMSEMMKTGAATQATKGVMDSPATQDSIATAIDMLNGG